MSAADEASVATMPSEGHGTFQDAEPVIQTEAARSQEELRMLLLGFGTGITIGLVFLVYIVLAYANWLP